MNLSHRRGLLYFTLCFGLVSAGCAGQQGDAIDDIPVHRLRCTTLPMRRRRVLDEEIR